MNAVQKAKLKIEIPVFGLLCLCWGTTWLAIKISLDTIPPILGVALRFTLASVLMLAIMAYRRQPFPSSWKLHVRLILVGILTFSLGYILVYVGEQYISSGLTSVLFSSFPLWISIFSHFMIPGERLTWWKLAGVLTGLTGVVVLFSNDLNAGANMPLGIGLVLSASLLGGFSNVYGKKLLTKVKVLPFNTLGMLYGATATWILWFFLENGRYGEFTPDTAGILATIYLALFGSVIPFMGWFWLIQRVDTTRVSMLTLFTPIIALVLGWLLLNEAITTSIFSGSALILTGLVLVLRGSRRTHDRS